MTACAQQGVTTLGREQLGTQTALPQQPQLPRWRLVDTRYDWQTCTLGGGGGATRRRPILRATASRGAPWQRTVTSRAAWRAGGRAAAAAAAAAAASGPWPPQTGRSRHLRAARWPPTARWDGQRPVRQGRILRGRVFLHARVVGHRHDAACRGAAGQRGRGAGLHGGGGGARGVECAARERGRRGRLRERRRGQQRVDGRLQAVKDEAVACRGTAHRVGRCCTVGDPACKRPRRDK